MDAIRLGIAVALLATGALGCATSTQPDFSTFTDAELYSTQQRIMADLERERLRDLPPEHPSLSRVDADTAKIERDQSEECVSNLLLRLEAIDAEMTSVDRLGFNLRIQTKEGMKGSRIAYPEPVESGDNVRKVFVQMVKAVRG